MEPLPIYRNRVQINISHFFRRTKCVTVLSKALRTKCVTVLSKLPLLWQLGFHFLIHKYGLQFHPCQLYSVAKHSSNEVTTGGKLRNFCIFIKRDGITEGDFIRTGNTVLKCIPITFLGDYLHSTSRIWLHVRADVSLWCQYVWNDIRLHIQSACLCVQWALCAPRNLNHSDLSPVLSKTL